MFGRKRDRGQDSLRSFQLPLTVEETKQVKALQKKNNDDNQGWDEAEYDSTHETSYKDGGEWGDVALTGAYDRLMLSSGHNIGNNETMTWEEYKTRKAEILQEHEEEAERHDGFWQSLGRLVTGEKDDQPWYKG